MVKTFREKNNESRRKCYNKKKEEELWETFELYSIDYHRSKHNHTTWHWNDIPEDHLNNAGFIHDFNKHRLRRISLFNNSEIVNKYKDYGLDGLSLDNNGVYHGIQAKCYFTKKVSANDIGTFQSVIINRLCNRCNDSKGYLYTIEDIETNLLEDISNGKVYNHEKICLEENIKEIVNTEIKEDSLSLWRHQTEALEVLKNREGLSLLSIICGTGKTVIAGHHLKTLEHETIVCIAPLRVSVEQLQIRLSCFLDNREYLLVDSDSKGTTDISIVKKFLESKNKKIIFSTFDSAINILDKILETRSYIVCDEVHNTVNNAEICNFINSFENGLLLTATPPEELLEQIETTEVYKYSLADAIKDKLVCDYTVWLPYDIQYDKIPKEINSMNKVDAELILKSVFLANGMLKTGSRRCIVYNKNRQECDDFCYAIKTVLREYHGIDCWTEKIDCETSSKKRLEILKEFQSGNNDKFYILTSVRILDEAIDIKKCDSEFITYIGEKSNDIRLVQRLMRGSRIDSMNPNKHNNLFIWANSDDNDLFGILSLLKDIDPNFHKKVKIISKDYDKQEKERKKIETKELVLEKGLSVKCISLKELWEIKKNLLFQFVEENERVPKEKEKYKNINIGMWLHRQKTKIDSDKSDVYKKLSENLIIKENLDLYLKNKEKDKLGWDEQKDLLFKFVEENERIPKEKEKYKNINIRQWLYDQKKKINSNECDIYKKLSKNQIIKEEIDRYLKNKEKEKIKLTWEEQKDLLFRFVEENKKIPTQKEIYNNINIGIWLHHQKEKIESNECEIYKKLSKNLIIKENLDKYLKYKEIYKEKIKLTWEEQKDLLFRFVEEHKRIPKKKENYKNINIRQWLQNQKNKIDSNECEIYKKLSENLIIKENLDQYLKYKEIKLTWEERKDLLFRFVEKYERVPKNIEKYENINIGQWFQNHKEKIISIECDVYKKLSENQIVKEEINRYLKNKEIKLTWEEQKKLLFRFVEEYKKIPKSKETYKNVNIGMWLQTQKSKINSDQCDVYKKLSENFVVKENLDQYLKNKEKIKIKNSLI